MTTESKIKEILTDPFDYVWTLQGFGMLRTYLDNDEVERLHIWDTNSAVPDVSVIHDHPWDFTSRIISGRLTNQRYVFDPEDGEEVSVAFIKTGEGGGLRTEPYKIHVISLEPEHYVPGDLYGQLAAEVHESIPSNGTVTLIERKFYGPRDDQVATVCWRTGDWVSAEPRPATHYEILHFTGLALSNWGSS